MLDDPASQNCPIDDISLPEHARKSPQAPAGKPGLEFTERGEGWPPKPRDRQDVLPISARELPGSLTAELEQQIRRAALHDKRVREALGERSAHILTDPILARKPRTKPRHERSLLKKLIAILLRAIKKLSKYLLSFFSGRRGLQPLRARLIFFSHSKNTAVEVLMNGIRVQSVNEKKSYQPPESGEEVREAIYLARADHRLKDKVSSLSASSILLPSRAGEEGYGHRILWVTFMDSSDSEDEKLPLYIAVVDLTDQTVLMAQPETPLRADVE